MDYDLDDPLDDILKSDNSTDSFFGAKSAKPAEKSGKAGKAVAVAKDDKTRMSNLFGIKPAAEPEPPRAPPPASIPAVTNTPTTKSVAPKVAEKPAKKKEVSFDAEDDDDSMTDLGFDPKKAKAKTNLFDDLLAPVAQKQEPNVKPQPVQRPKTATAPQSVFEDLPERPKTSTRNSPKKSLKDPLGLFSPGPGNLSKQPSREEIKPSNFDWLGQETKKPEEPVAPVKEVEVSPPPHPPVKQEAPIINPSLSSEAVLLEALQRQESQLSIAAQMKHQETVLLEMQQRQKNLLQQQEVKFQELLQSQINRQTLLEGTIRSQQNRINSHLENLMNQPMDVNLRIPDAENPIKTSSNKNHENSRDEELIELQNEVKRLELEKLRFEDLFSNATAIHEQEVSFIEQSHKKQIQLLEDQVHQVEDRLKQENKTLEEFYKNKLELLEKDKREVTEKYEKKLQDLKEEHLVTLDTLKASHSSAMTHLRDSKLMEFSQLEDRFSYLEHLKSAAKYMETATGDIESLRVTINERIETLHKEKERELERREKRVELEQKHLEIVQENAKTEQKRLLELVYSLEAKLHALSKDSSEEQWIVRQKLAALDAERSAFEREQSFFREQQKKDELRMEELKASTLREQTAILEEIQREKEQLADEKVRLATQQKLNEARGPKNVQGNQHEVEIAIQVAKEATRQSDLERDNWLEKQRQCELKKREIIEFEQKIKRKETELEVMLNAARDREQTAENFVRNAKMMEQKVVAKYQQLMGNVQDLVERERKLSEEKQALSKERMEMQAKKQNNENRCGLCKVGMVTEGQENFNYNYNDLNVGFVSGVDLMFSRELNAILKQVPQSEHSFK